jgi:hypothetical protein
VLGERLTQRASSVAALNPAQNGEAEGQSVAEEASEAEGRG